jgi:peptide/nickel transport system substrate-binding protein
MVRRFGVRLVAAALLAAGCDSQDAGGPAVTEGDYCDAALARVDSFMASLPAPAGERRGGTAVVATISEMADGMNSLVSSDYFANQHQVFVNLMTLIRMDAELRLVPYLARSWEVSEDVSQLVFHLRDDIYWHDGVKTTAYDVAFTYLRATDPETAFPNASFWTHYVRGTDGVEVVDSFTVRVALRPHAEYLDPWVNLAVLPAHLLEDVPAAELRQHPFGTRCPVGNGPFRFVEHRQDESWMFEANPGFPTDLGGPPNLDRYVYRVVPEQTTLLTELLTEGVDVYVGPPPDQALAIMDSDVARLIHFPFRAYTFVGWNSRRPQLADARVRRAITMATNRQQILEALVGGYGRIANAGVPPFHWAYDPSTEQALAYDPAGARALLGEAGWVDRDGDGVRENAEGVELRIGIKYNQGNQQRQDIAEIMQAQLQEVGIEVVPQVVEFATLLSQINTPSVRDFDGVVMAWVTGFTVDDTDFFHSSNIDEPLGWSGMQDPRLDHLLDTMSVIPTREEALPFWREFQARVIDLQPFTYFFFRERLEGISRRLQGVTMDMRGEWANITDWWIPADQRKYTTGNR